MQIWRRSVSQERRAFLKTERRYAYTQDTDIALFHATSAGAPLRDSYFADASVAEAEAQRLIGLYNYGRAMYEVVVKNALFSVHVGETVHLTYHRWDLSGGKRFVVVGVADDADRVETTLLGVWIDMTNPLRFTYINHADVASISGIRVRHVRCRCQI